MCFTQCDSDFGSDLIERLFDNRALSFGRCGFNKLRHGTFLVDVEVFIDKIEAAAWDRSISCFNP